MENQHNESQLIVNTLSKNYLNETQKWSKFLSIVGFIGIGLLIVFSIFIGFFMPNFLPSDQADIMSGGLFGFVYLLMAALYFFPVLYMYKFSKHMKTALSNNDTENIDEAFKYLKSQYKFMGIYTIVCLGIYILSILGMAIFAMFSM
jgi:uncharacterized membrane protein